ncbi:MAG: hypothetical protein BGO82_13330 [Devosia sp. 67-54]|uniref:hypothetical protein n=1 Tax=unclassified Devosia TaxID=196773 RepID=UPI00095BDFF4|nr:MULTISPECIES: hypothetical protein [unclassified Devosia]MBN9306599.1 hypothetical protein [Devosia sp.]OJX15879.1 MAG: hypothetical protein BGO82_13330 [Devosia sp. 67-54]
MLWLVPTLLVLAAPTLAAGSANPPAAAPVATEAPPAKSDFVLEGFRSAKFGMTQDKVRAAIKADFGLSGDAVVAGTNAAERTQLLTIVVPDLLPDGGKAQVSYVFGYSSKTLIQVGVSWNASIDPKVDAAKLYANSDVLVAYFTAQGYLPATIRTGVVLDNGILLFRGEDKDGHAAIVLLQGDFTGGGDTQKVLKPTSLALLYAADSKEPDIFKLDPGAF